MNCITNKSIVKIVRYAERFWVIVRKIYKNGTIVGIVNNKLLTKKLKYGDKIYFKRDEIVDIYHC